MSSRRASHRAPKASAAPSAADRHEIRRIRMVAAAIVLSGVAAYANSFSNPFVLDDSRAIVENPQIREVWPLSVPLSPPKETPVARRPVVNLTFALNYAVGGVEPPGYRAGNVAILLLTALALFGVVRRTLRLESMAPRFGAHATWIAAAGALLWALHPLNSEVINYVSQRTTALMGLFYVVTVYCSLRALAGGAAPWRIGAIASCAAGMACKESMVTAPIVVLFFDRIFVFPSLREAVRQRGLLYAGLAGTWVLLAALMASGGRTTVGFAAGITPWTYLLNQFTVLTEYLRLTFWPRALIVDYGLPQALTAGDVLWSAGVLGVLAAASVAALRYRPAAGFLGTTFFVTLAPTSSIVPIVTEVGAERRMYLPLAALIVLLVCAAYRAWAVAAPAIAARLRLDAASTTAFMGRRAAAAVVGSLAILLAWGTVLRNAEYASPETLARTVVERKPHGRAYYSLAHALFEQGERDQAIRYFQRSAADFPGAHFPLGAELLVDGELEAGIRQLQTFIDLMPTHAAVPGARQMIATALAAQGNTAEAIAELRMALEAEPRNPRANGLLGELLLQQQSAPEATRYLERAAALQPADARLQNLLGTALAMQGRVAEALPHFQRAADLDPDHANARANLERARQLLARSRAN